MIDQTALARYAVMRDIAREVITRKLQRANVRLVKIDRAGKSRIITVLIERHADSIREAASIRMGEA